MKLKMSSGKIEIMSIIILVWLAGLTAGLLLFMKKPQDQGDLTARVEKLEARTRKVGGKLVKPGTAAKNGDLDRQVKALDARLGQMEKRLADMTPEELKTAAAAPVSASASEICDCDDLKNRMARLEARLADGGVPVETAAKTEPAESEKTAAVSKSEPKKSSKPAARISKRSPKKKKSRKSARISRAAKKRGSRRPGYTAAYDQTYTGPSVWTMSMKYGPMYGYSDRQMRSMSSLAPGAAVYAGAGGRTPY